MAQFVTIGELQQLAEEKIPSPVIDFILTAGGSGQTLDRNMRALAELAIEQQILIGSAPLDIRTEFLGVSLPSPVIVCPMGGLARLHSDGDLAMARGAGGDGTMWVSPCRDNWSLEEIAEAAPGPLLFQTYCDEKFDRSEQRDQIARVEARPEFKGVVVTVDAGTANRPDRLLRTRPFGDRPPAPGAGAPSHRFTWQDLDHLRGNVHLPMGLKGICSGRDADAAIEHGADFVWVSNHGGRHLDSARAAIDVLDEVADCVGGRVPIVIDSGFQRGSDVLKAVAKGASLVGIGKLAACALGLDGAEGVAALLQILQEELEVALGLSGRASLGELGPEVICRVGY